MSERSLDLPEKGWTKVTKEERAALTLQISPGEPEPEGAEAYRAPGDENMEFVLFDSPSCWPTLWMRNLNVRVDLRDVHRQRPQVGRRADREADEDG